MKRTVWAVVLLSVTLAGLLFGCTPTSDPCGTECSGKEPNETGCDEGAVDVTRLDGIVAPGLEGSIAIRKSDPAVCEDIYWARFAPSEGTTSAFEVILKINGEVVSIPGQQSDPTTPSLYAWTKGYRATEGDVVSACVIPEGLAEICVESTLS